MIIKNARIIDKDTDLVSNVTIEDGIIKKISTENEDGYQGQVIDAKGLALMPSFIDLHTHLREPGFTDKEDLESGQKAALRGGYTHLCAMANTKPVCDNSETMEYIKKRCKDLDLCKVIQISAFTKGLKGEEVVDIDEMKEHTDLFSDDGYTIMDEEIMKTALIKSKEKKFKIMTHCQPEVQTIKRDLRLLEEIGGDLHICHISKKESLEEINRYREKGMRFTCEVTPHHIFASSMDYRVNPSIRDEEDRKFMIEGIRNGQIDAIGTDHAPHTAEDKKNGSPGISIIEAAFSMCMKVFEENDISIKRLSQVMSYNPAKILGLNAGLVREGFEANLVLADLEKDHKLDVSSFVSKGKNNPFDKADIKGQIVMTIRNGKIKYNGR